jgi:diaminopimelate decarboxylase
MLDSFLLSLQEAGCGVTHLEYGTGFAVPYFDPVKEVTTRDENLTAFAEMTRAMTWKGRVNIEMGRALSACCGYYMTAILDQKVSDGTGWIITDGGIHQIGYDGQIKGMYKPFITLLRGSEENRKEWPVSQWTVCGSLCTVNDILCRDLELDQPQKGDVLVFERAGAYCVTEGMALFLSHELPEILLYSDRDGLFCAREMMETCDLNRGRL